MRLDSLPKKKEDEFRTLDWFTLEYKNFAYFFLSQVFI